MVSTIISAGINGLEGFCVTVEADVSDGLPILVIVGSLSGEVREAKDRVRSALRNSNFHFPVKRITISLSPADVHKTGSGFDLPIAIAILCAFEMLPANRCSGVLFVGELGLDGSLVKIPGVMEIAARARSFGCHTCIVPLDNLKEGSVIDDVEVLGASCLMDVVNYLLGRCQLQSYHFDYEESKRAHHRIKHMDFEDLQGQQRIRRGAEIAVSGFHNFLMIGPPGSGKTMAAKCIPSILPPLSKSESLEISRIHSVAGTLPEDEPLLFDRPFRSPHHTATRASLAGGGMNPRPGEITLAHRGVLFLDEFAEFPGPSVEVLRQPLEDGFITITRAGGTCRFPTDFILIAGSNPCPCGYHPDRTRCRCSEAAVRRYLSRISGPLLDRIDLCAEAEMTSYSQISSAEKAESSAVIRARVEKTLALQQERYKGTGIRCNADLTISQLKKYCVLSDEASRMLEGAFTRMNLTGRTYVRILRVARTIADMEGSDSVLCDHLAEAISYRVSFLSGGV